MTLGPHRRAAIRREQITGLILAGGQGSRMGGIDKGLEPLQGRPLVEHAIERLAPQVGRIAISANRNHEIYARYGFPVFEDRDVSERLPSRDAAPRSGDATHGTGVSDVSRVPRVSFGGPLAGIATGLESIATEWMLVVPCDAPLFPLDLAARLAEAIEISTAPIAYATTTEPDGTCLRHPVFALIPARLASDAAAQLDTGRRRLDAWYAHHSAVQVGFRDSRAFYNANTLHDLRELER